MLNFTTDFDNSLKKIGCKNIEYEDCGIILTLGEMDFAFGIIKTEKGLRIHEIHGKRDHKCKNFGGISKPLRCKELFYQIVLKRRNEGK